jgi:YfiR/HmsC-like
MKCTWPGAAPLLVGLLTGFLSPGLLASQDERGIRAAYVFNLTKYVEWPPESKQLVIGVFGNRATGEFLKKLLDGRMSGSRPIRLMLSPALAELRDCNILYLADGFAKKTFAAVQDMHLKGMLTLGENGYISGRRGHDCPGKSGRPDPHPVEPGGDRARRRQTRFSPARSGFDRFTGNDCGPDVAASDSSGTSQPRIPKHGCKAASARERTS